MHNWEKKWLLQFALHSNTYLANSSGRRVTSRLSSFITSSRNVNKFSLSVVVNVVCGNLPC